MHKNKVHDKKSDDKNNISHFAKHPLKVLPGCQSDLAGFWPSSAAACPLVSRWQLDNILHEWQLCSVLCSAVCYSSSFGLQCAAGGSLTLESSWCPAQQQQPAGRNTQPRRKQHLPTPGEPVELGEPIAPSLHFTYALRPIAPLLLSNVVNCPASLTSSACDPESPSHVVSYLTGRRQQNPCSGPMCSCVHGVKMRNNFLLITLLMLLWNLKITSL